MIKQNPGGLLLPKQRRQEVECFKMMATQPPKYKRTNIKQGDKCHSKIINDQVLLFLLSAKGAGLIGNSLHKQKRSLRDEIGIHKHCVLSQRSCSHLLEHTHSCSHTHVLTSCATIRRRSFVQYCYVFTDDKSNWVNHSWLE